MGGAGCTFQTVSIAPRFFWRSSPAMNEVSSELVGLNSTGTVTVAGLLPSATTVGTDDSFTGTIVIMPPPPPMGVPL